MSDVLIYTPTRFAVPASGFDSEKRYMRKASGASLVISGGRTWRFGDPTINTGEPWCGFRFDIGVAGAETNATSTVVGGFTESQAINDVDPIVTAFTLQ